MRILIASQYFYPEEFKVNDLAVDLVNRGHKVTVLTGKPNYPLGKYHEGYKFWGIQKENYKGVNVIRVPLVRRGNGTSLRLVINYLSYVFFGCLYAFLHKDLKCDAVICFGTSPITQIYPAFVLKKRYACKVGLWIQDLWPESVWATSPINNKILSNMLVRMVHNIYEKCDVLYVQSQAFKDSICEKGDFSKKIIYAPNWAETLFCQTIPNVNKYKHLIPSGFVVMFAGNIGEAQDFDSIIDAANLTKKNSNIKWVIVGDGRRRKHAEQRVKDEGLSHNVIFLGRYSVKEMPHFFVHADVMLVSLKSKDIFSLTIPSKIQAYMASGKPIVTMLDGIGSKIIDEAGCGLTANSGDVHHLAKNIITLSQMSKSELMSMGEKALKYYCSNFEKTATINTILYGLGIDKV